VSAADGGRLLFGSGLITSLPAILLIAFVAGRLLGVRRSLATTLLSGLAGWIAGTGLSLVIADGDPDAPGFGRNVWVFSIVFTMSAAVWVELLAKPGSLARAQQGLVRVPRPLRALRRSSQRVRRYGQITGIAVKHGFGPALGLAGRPDQDGQESGRLPVAARLRRALEECGGMFVKLGQILSTRSDLLPAGVIAELSRLRDRVPPADPDAVRALIEAELGAPAGEVFAEFESEPLAAASIGQAHRARLHDGQPVIVKVLRPGIGEAVERDLLVLDELARTVEARTPWGAEYRVTELTAEFGALLREELDLRREAGNATAIAANLAELPQVHIPEVHPELSTSRLLVMEWLDGVSVGDTAALDELGVDRRALADLLLRCFLKQMLLDGEFHADPHPGNVMVLRDGRLGLIDFGAASRLDPLEQASVRTMLVAVSRRDSAMLRDAIAQVATLRRHVDDDQFERALARFMARHLARGATPSAAMLNDLLQLLFAFGVTLPPEFSTFFRALVTLEGTIVTLSPGYQVIQAAQEVAAEWAGEQLTVASVQELARDELLRLAPLLRRAPRHLDRVASLVERGDLRARVSLFADEADVQVLTRLVNRVVLAALGGVVGVLSVVLLGTDGGPPFTGDTSLFQFFGYFGLFCATTLILRVIVAIMHDGLS
jgi:ubiquinone biosynthesis protein